MCREGNAEDLKLELIIINDASSDNSLTIAHGLAEQYPIIKVLNHEAQISGSIFLFDLVK